MHCIKAPAFSAWLLAGLCFQAAADVTVIQLANEGAVISDGQTRVMIDGMVVDSYSIYGGLQPHARVALGPDISNHHHVAGLEPIAEHGLAGVLLG